MKLGYFRLKGTRGGTSREGEVRLIVICLGIRGRGRWSDCDTWDDWQRGRCGVSSMAGLSSKVVEICVIDYLVERSSNSFLDEVL